MSTDEQMLLLTELEAEVVEAALELYLQLRPVPLDRRFEYRYRAAQAVLQSLRRGCVPPAPGPRGDDEDTSRSEEELPLRRPLKERIED